MVDERTAHTYIRNPTGVQRANLTYIGVILEKDRVNAIRDVSKAKKDKFGALGMGEENDSIIIESRAYADELLEEKMSELVKHADITIMPGNWDYMFGNINNADSFINANGGLKEAVRMLKS